MRKAEKRRIGAARQEQNRAEAIKSGLAALSKEHERKKAKTEMLMAEKKRKSAASPREL